MIRKVMSILFGNNSLNTYKAHPLDMVYSIFFLALGVVTATRDNWYAFGVITATLGTLLGIAIILAIDWEKVIEYWSTLDDFAKTMNKVTNPELWEALGFTAPEKSVQVKEIIEHGQGFNQIKLHDLPISSAVLQSISNAVLTGSPFSEAEIVKRRKLTTSPKFRDFQKTAREKDWVRPNNSRDNRQGFALTRKGRQVFYSFASESVKQKLKEEENGSNQE